MKRRGVRIDSRAGRDNVYHLYLPGPSSAPTRTIEPRDPAFGALSRRGPPAGGTQPSTFADDRPMSEGDRSLTREIDAYRDMMEEGSAKRAGRSLQALLGALPQDASPYVAFRIKANLGHCALQLGDEAEALGWFDDAVATAPAEPRAIALKAYAMLVRGEAAEARDFALAELGRDPQNEHIAAHAIEAAILLDDGTDTEPSVPIAMRERERVLVARCILRRQRDERPAWWNLARLGARRFPASKVLKLFATEAEVDEIARACRGETYRRVSAEERRRLETAAAHLEARWRQIRSSDVPRRDDGLAALAAAMIARTLLGDRDAAMALAGDLVAHTDEEGPLTMACQMANAVGDDAIAKAAMAKLPDDGPAAFLKGIAASNDGDWAVAAGHFSKATVPESERLFVEMIIRLGDIDGMENDAARSALRDAARSFGSDARALIVVSGMAERKRLPDIATEAYRQATALIGSDLHHSARVMIAAHAYRSDDFDVIIRVLDGHVETGVWSKELQWLADAHASEHPPRPRNLRFFDGLPRHTRRLASIARGHASKLLDKKREKLAEPILRRIVEETPTDVFAQLKLVEAIERIGPPTEAKAVVRAADESAMRGPSSYRLQWAHRLREADEPHRAIAYAYDLLRAHPLDPKIALGYVALVFADRSETIIPEVDAVAPGCWVEIEGPSGDSDAFLIDEGQSVLGIDVVPPSHARAMRLLGLREGQTVETVSIGGHTTTWILKEVKSKYLAVLHTVMQTFEQRFPTSKGLWRVTLDGPDIQPVLDVVREQAKAKRESTERLYVESRLPLALAARAVGTDVMSFAHYLRTMDLEIATASGFAADNEAGIAAARDYRGAGATLDAYTAMTAAEMDCLEALAGWFGALAVPASTIETVDELIAHARGGISKESMSIGWKDGAFFKEEVSDEILNRQIEQLQAIRAKLTASCEVVAAELPDDLPQDVAQFIRTTGRESMDAMYLAASRGDILVSEDLHYRQIAAGLTKVDGTWLQIALLSAHVAGGIDRARYANACAQLAHRRHGNLWLDDAALVMASEECNARDFAAVCHYIGSRNAHIWSHTMLAARSLSRIWSAPAAGLKRETLTSTVVGSLLRHRRDDWHYCLAALWLAADGDPALRNCLARWIRGHFIPLPPIQAAEQQWRNFLRQTGRPASSAASPRALLAGDAPQGPVQLDLAATPPRRTRTDTMPDAVRSELTRRRPGKRARRRRKPR